MLSFILFPRTCGLKQLILKNIITFFKHSFTNPHNCITWFYSVCLSKAAHLHWVRAAALLLRPEGEHHLPPDKEQHHHHSGGKIQFENLFLRSVTLLNHLFIENHMPFIHIDANPAKFNTRCACYRGYETQKQTMKSVAEKQQRSFHCQTARVSGSVYRPSMKPSKKSNQCFMDYRLSNCAPRRATQAERSPHILLFICEYVGCKYHTYCTMHCVNMSYFELS